jgi:hypothetical protein
MYGRRRRATAAALDVSDVESAPSSVEEVVEVQEIIEVEVDDDVPSPHHFSATLLHPTAEEPTVVISTPSRLGGDTFSVSAPSHVFHGHTVQSTNLHTSARGPARLATPPAHLAGVPVVMKPMAKRSNPPSADKGREPDGASASRPASRARRQLPTPMKTPFSSPAITTTGHARSRSRTPTPAQQADALNKVGSVYARILASNVHHRHRSLSPSETAAPAGKLASASSSHRSKSSSPRRRSTPTPHSLKTPAAAAPSPSNRRYQPRPLPPAITRDESKDAHLQYAMTTPGGTQRHARPMPALDVCMCLSPEVALRLSNVFHRASPTPQRGAQPRPLPAVESVDPELESRLPVEVLHFAEKRFARRKVFQRWRIRLQLRRQIQHIETRRLQCAMGRWRVQARLALAARALRERHIVQRSLSTWRRRLYERRDLREADVTAHNETVHRALRTWNLRLRQRGDEQAADRIRVALPALTCLRHWRRRCAEAGREKRMRLGTLFYRWAAVTRLRRTLQQLSLPGKVMRAWQAEARLNSSAEMRGLASIAQCAENMLRRRCFAAWVHYGRNSMHLEKQLQLNSDRLHRRQIRRTWFRWCTAFTRSRAARRRALLMQLAV